MKKSLLILLFVACKIAIAQSSVGKDTIPGGNNFTDTEGKKQGKWVILGKDAHKPEYKDDQKVEEGKYIDSKKTGIWKEYYPNDNLKSSITYENNRPSGYAKMYHDNGKIKEEGMWKNNRWTGDYKLYYDNGQVQQAFAFDATGKRAGKQTYFYENGQTMIEGTWDGGKEAGVVTEYYDNGEKKSEKNFNGGVLDIATTKTFDQKKPTKVVAEVVKEAPPIIPDKKETPNLKTPFNGEGYWKLYNQNKQVSKDGTFSKNRLVDGKVYFYSSDGILTRIAVYKGGKYVGDSVIEE
jgi:antitoxin component YwqK of YwqJK toxin-antitoxin module